MQVQAEIQDGIRCAVCEKPFGAAPTPTWMVREQGVMVHEGCWE